MADVRFEPNESAQHGPYAESVPVVLVPLDGSPASAAVVPVARTFAHILGGTIHLLHVADPPLSPQAVLETLHLEPGAVRGLVVSSGSGPPAEAVVAFAESHRCQLIAMSTQGWTADPKVALGSVAEEVLRRAGRPLLLVRPQVGAGWGSRQVSLSRILVPLDGTPRTADALGPAAELAQRSGAAVDVLHVVVPKQSASDEPGAMTVPQYTDQPHYAWPAWRAEFINRFCQCFPQPPEHFLVAVGEPGEEVLRVAREQESQLIVLAWKGELKGNRARTVRSVLSQALCPVLCVRTESSVRGTGHVELSLATP